MTSILKGPAKYIVVVAVLVAGFFAFKMYTPENVSAEQQAALIEPAASSENTAATQKTPRAWNVRCNKAATPEEEAQNKRGRCEVFQKLSVQETGQRFAEFAIGFPEGEKNARGIMVLPLGILLESGVEMSIDDGQAFKIQVRYCDKNGCFAYLSLNDTVLNMLKNGKKAGVKIQNNTGKGIAFEMPLTGFSKAFDEVG